MTNRHTAKRGRAAAVAVAAVAVLALAGCGGDDGGKKDEGGSSKGTNSPKETEEGKDGKGKESPEPEPAKTLAEIKGEKDVSVAITEARRDSGGFVTVKGTVTNGGEESFSGAARWMGTEQELNRSGSSVAGAVLVDQSGKKRYYVLRDTEGRCLCTMGLVSIGPEQTVPFFAQFPAPPDDVTKVEFQLPTMPPAQIEISE